MGERLCGDNLDPIYNERKNNFRKQLPAFTLDDVFCKKIFEHDVMVLCGATGCGITTQLPQVLMEAAAKLTHEQHTNTNNTDKRHFGTGRIICTQPRRISATSVAERVSFERNEKMGDRVGYQIRFEQHASDTTELLHCTTGILLRFLVSNPKLKGIPCVMIDEVHERGIHTDFVLMILKDLVLERKGTNEPLKLVLMSATIDASNFLNYFDSNSSVEFNIMLVNENRDNDVFMADNDNDDFTSFNGKLFSVSFIEIPGKTNYLIEEYFIEDICHETGPSLVLRGPPPTSSNQGRVSVQEVRNPWASPEAVREKYYELGLQLKKSNSKVGKHVWKNLSNVLQRPFQLDVDLICKVVEHVENIDGLTKINKLQRKMGGPGDSCFFDNTNDE